MQHFATTLVLLTACTYQVRPNPDGGESEDPAGACEITKVTRLPGANVTWPAPNRVDYLENKPDTNGVNQVYVGKLGSPSSCISCATSAQKLSAVWHPSRPLIFAGVEMPHWRPPWISPEQDVGLMQCGTNLNMYAARSDGSAWYQLTHYDSSNPSAGGGYTGPAISPDGAHAYWATIVDGNIFAYSFGRWRLMRADVVYDPTGAPSFHNITDITPPATNWIEPGTISPDGRFLALTLDTGLQPNKAGGMDQWLLDLTTGSYINLNQTPTEWDEHGVFAPSSKKIVFMSSHPYDYSAATSLFQIFGLATEFMMIDIDGTHLTQLTHFHDPGYPEYTAEGNVASVALFSADGRKLYATQLLTAESFPNQVTWEFEFAGNCGGS